MEPTLFHTNKNEPHRMTLRGMLLVLLSLARITECGEPVFDPATLMRLVLVPADAVTGSVIYRVRASDPDFDYPLQFELIGQMGRLDIAIESLPCTRYNSVCQANVILLRRLEPGRYVDFRLSVRNTRGRSARIACSITGTNATTPRDTIFPHQPGIILVPEDARRGIDLEIVIARKNPMSTKPAELELWGSPLFAIRQRRASMENTEGAIFLLGPLDFEMQSMYHLTLLAVDPYVERGKDTRNIAGIEVVVVVQDVQDMPPVFTHAPPVTHLPRRLVPSNVVARVRAEDGDKGAPRQIRYGLVSEGNPFTPFFNINETSGEIILERPLEEIAAISHAGTPILLTVVAEEVRLSREEPEAMSSTVQLAFILPERDNTPPYFENPFYITYLDENSPQGTALIFTEPYIPQVSDNDSAKNAVFSLSLLGNNGTFEVSPSVAERHTQFFIKVRDNTLLDYEARKSVIFQIRAQELGPASNLSVTTNVTVYLNDVNDNSPVFLELSYEVELAENATAGTKVTQVQADDVDTGVFGKIQYTAIIGYLNTSLHLDPMTGAITVATNSHGFDREAMPDLHFLIEARDNDGLGLRETVPLVIKLLDVNDNAPEFERNLYEFVLSPNLDNFTSTAYVKASDKDAEPPNNVVRYEIIHGNNENKFALNAESGELFLLEPLKRTSISKDRHKRQFENEEESEVYVLAVRAYDLGVPRLFTSTMIKIYPPESKTRTMTFIIPGSNPDRRKLEEVLSTLSGGKVTILEVRPYSGNEIGANDVTSGGSSQNKSVVVALVRMSGSKAINIAKLQEQLSKNRSLYTTSSDNADGSVQFGSDTDTSGTYKAENRLLFWLLILLAVLIALVLLTLICCCVCDGCPLYMPPRKRVIRVNSTEDDVHLMVRDTGHGRQNRSTQNLESKSIQATDWHKRDAWSAEHTDLRTKPTQWKFNRRNYSSKSPMKPASTPGDIKRDFILPAAAKELRYVEGRNSTRMREGPKIIYTKEMQLQEAFANKHREYIEDLENGYDRIATLHYHRKDRDDESIRRHELERGSEVYDKDEKHIQDTETYKLKDTNDRFHASPSGRDQYFTKEGNTEILRLVTRGKNQEEERYVNVPVSQQRPIIQIPKSHFVLIDNGKDMLMERFIREQREEAKNMRDKLNGNYSEHEKNYDQQSRAGSGVSQIFNPNDNRNAFPEVPGSVPLKSENLQNTLLEMQNKSTLNQELLESSLRKQNELLHKILLERERLLQNNETSSQIESKLETQSLPGHSVIATQTECHISTQTEPHLLKPSRRRARSDNDSYSEEEDSQEYLNKNVKQVAWVKRRKPKKKIKTKDPRRSIRIYEIKRKIRTPILEENEISSTFECKNQSKNNEHDETGVQIKGYDEIKKSTVRTSINETTSKTEIICSSKPALQRDVLMEISDSLEERVNSSSGIGSKRTKLTRQTIVAETYDEEFEKSSMPKPTHVSNECIDRMTTPKEDSRNKIFSRQGSSTDAKKEQASKMDFSQNMEQKNEILKENKADHKNDKSDESGGKSGVDSSKVSQKSVPRYMQWYNKKNETLNTKPASERNIPSKPKRNSKLKNTNENVSEKEKSQYGKLTNKEKESTDVKKNFKSQDKNFKIHPRILKEEKVLPVPEGPLPDAHPLLQHSEHRYEHQYENQNPLCHIQPTHIPQYLGMQSQLPAANNRQPSQPLYANQTDIKDINQNISEGALTHSISISSSCEEEKPSTEIHVSKIKIGNNTNLLNISNKSSKIDDNDSGIAMSTLVHQGGIKRIPITEKKSIFTIAYDDVHTKQLRPDSSSTSY